MASDVDVGKLVRDAAKDAERATGVSLSEAAKAFGPQRGPASVARIEAEAKATTIQLLQIENERQAAELSSLRKQLDEAEKQVKEAEEARSFTLRWYAERYERLHQWMRENAPDEAQHQYFSIIANGTATTHEPPTYAQQMNTLRYRLEAAEKQVKELQADATRYRHIRDEHAQMHSPKMNGQHGWRFRCGINGRGNTFDEAIDNEINNLKGGA